MYINDPKHCKNALKKQFALLNERSKRHEPLTEGGDYRTDRHFEFTCMNHSWFSVVVDLSRFQSYENGYFCFQNCTLNYIALYYDHPEYGTSELASSYDFKTYDNPHDMHEDIMRALITAYGVITTYKAY